MLRFSRILPAIALLGVSASAVAAQGTTQPTRLPATTITSDNNKRVTVQNDRQTAITLYIDAGRVDRAIGTIDAGSTSAIELPTWATRGQRAVKVIARTERDGQTVATYSVPLNESRAIGLLVPPDAGASRVDSLLVTLPKGAASATSVTVANKRAGAIEVYAEWGLLTVRLGEVAANAQETLLVPESITNTKGAVRVFARPLGASGLGTKALSVESGDHLAVIVM